MIPIQHETKKTISCRLFNTTWIGNAKAWISGIFVQDIIFWQAFRSYRISLFEPLVCCIEMESLKRNSRFWSSPNFPQTHQLLLGNDQLFSQMLLLWEFFAWYFNGVVSLYIKNKNNLLQNSYRFRQFVFATCKDFEPQY